jgi:hypothetical protein
MAQWTLDGSTLPRAVSAALVTSLLLHQYGGLAQEVGRSMIRPAGRLAHACGEQEKTAVHRGNPYPRHPTYWATEAWFWPGFMPWKMYASADGLLAPPWNIMPPDWGGLSDAGVPSIDAKEILYTWTVTDVPWPFVLKVRCDKAIVLGGSKARWEMMIGDGTVVWSTAFLLQDFPQRHVYARFWEFCVPAPPYTSAAGPPIEVRPATYAEGGSPWD